MHKVADDVPLTGMSGVKTISPVLHRKLFAKSQPLLPDDIVDTVNAELEKFGLRDIADDTEDGELPLPPWATSAKDMFQKAASAFLGNRKELLDYITQASTSVNTGTFELINKEVWRSRFTPGWNLVTNKGVTPIDELPADSAYVFDFETLPLNGTDKAWVPLCCIAGRCLPGGRVEVYLWFSGFERPKTAPFPNNCVAGGWNVTGYDRMYLGSEWSIEPSGNVFPDLMSMHICCRGATNQQVPLLKMHEKDSDMYMPAWVDETSSNSLAAVYAYHFGENMDKGVRDEIKKDLTGYWSRLNIANILEYCYTDFICTLRLWLPVYTEYRTMNPRDTQLVGHLVSSTSFVPLDPDRWYDYYPGAEALYQKTIAEINADLMAIATATNDAAKEWMQHEQEIITAATAYTRSIAPIKPSKKALTDKALNKKIRDRLDVQRQRYLHLVNLLGEDYIHVNPLESVRHLCQTNRAKLDPWTRELDWTHNASNWYYVAQRDGLTLNKRVVPLLLKIKYMGLPIRYSEEAGWHTDKERIPHPEGGDKLCTAMFSKDMKELYTEGLLTTDHPNLKQLLSKVESTVIWTSMRKRIALMKIHEVDFDGQSIPMYVPQTLSNGTASSQREKSGDIHVFPHPKPPQPEKGKLGAIGSGFLSLIKPPEGYSIVKFDFDSQELRLSSDCGNLELGYIASTPLSFVVEVGNKDKGTDFHAVNQRTTGISNRTLVKNFGYAIIYGAGKYTLVLTALKGGVSLAEAEAYVKTFRETFIGILVDGVPVGGLASAMFRVLKRLGAEYPLRSLFGDVQLSRAISGQKDFATTRNNAVIQSTGRVMLNHVMTLIPYLAEQYSIPCRYMLSRHDEIAYMVKKGYELQFAYVMQLAHMYTWALYTKEMGLNTLGLGRAYASSVEVLGYYLKDPKASSITPDMPIQVTPGYSLTKLDLLAAIDAGTLQY